MTQAPKPITFERAMIPIALRPDDAAEALGISPSFLDKLVKAGKIRPPVAIPGSRVVRYDREHLLADWRALRDESLNGNADSWGDA